MLRLQRFLAILFIVALPWSVQGQKKITLEDLFKNYTFFPDYIYGLQSMKDGMHYSVQEDVADIVEYSYETGEKTALIIDGKKAAAAGIKAIAEYSLSDDEKKILLVTNREAIYRRSFKADYYVYDRVKDLFTSLSAGGKQQLATFSPDGNQVAFVRMNNIFVKNLTSGLEKQITTDGEMNHIINGVPDWVYEEEFEYNQAFCWSPDGRYLAYCRFDESAVRTYGMMVYKGLSPELKENALYPEYRNWKYPKAGEDNSVVTVHICELATGKTITADVGAEKDQYIPRIKWAGPANELCIYRLNRLQNKLELLLAAPETGNSRIMYTEENKYYLDETLFDSYQFDATGGEMLMLSEKEGWTQLYMLDVKSGKTRKLTTGNYDVTSILGFDETSGIIYFQAAAESPLRREVYAIHEDGSGLKKLSSKVGTNEAEFSSGCKYYINNWSDASSPFLFTLHKADGTQIRVLEDNARLKATLQAYQLPQKEFFQFKTSEGVELNGFMIKPSGFSKRIKYPVLMTQYSGPNSQEVADSWSVGWENYLAQEGYLVVCVDGRGTGFRGEEFRKMTYLQLGKFETIDQVETAKYLGTLPFVDKTRIGIFGWSFGGFMACNCLTKGAGTFRAGIAVAPVTNWRYYDNIYTERFLRKPQDNPSGYDDNSPIFSAEKLSGKLLIVHGTADDNVHLQNTVEFAEALVQAGKQFEMQLYTNRNHGIYGGNTTLHLYTRMTNFLKDNL